MVGGKVIGLARQTDSTLVHVRGTGCEKSDEVSIRVVERRVDNGDPVQIGLGDSIWWQGGYAMWTPVGVSWIDDPSGCGRRWDIHLSKVGYSH